MVVTPCIGVCDIERGTEPKRCRSCKRLLTEIATWGRMTPEEREAIIKDLPNR